MIKSSGLRKYLAYHATRTLVQLLAKTVISPNVLTWAGFLVTVVAMVLVINNHLFAAGLLVLVGGFFDMLDGALARHVNRATRFGAILDSVLDRFSDAAILVGIVVFYAGGQTFILVTLAVLALLGSLLVSYTRARAEAAGLECKVGLFTRAERVVAIALGLLLSRFDYALVTALGIIAVLSFATVGQRMVHIWRQTKV